MDLNKIVGIVLVASGFFDIVVLVKILERARGEGLPSFITAAIWITGVLTIIIGSLLYLGVFGKF
jgi:hypothetical protein